MYTDKKEDEKVEENFTEETKKENILFDESMMINNNDTNIRQSDLSCSASGIDCSKNGTNYENSDKEILKTSNSNEFSHYSKKSRRHAWGCHSYADIITKAIESSPEQRLTLAQIYDWMIKNIPYFAAKSCSGASAGWKNSVRHNLSLHEKFVRIRTPAPNKFSFWTVNYNTETPIRKQSYSKPLALKTKRHVPLSKANSISGSEARNLVMQNFNNNIHNEIYENDSTSWISESDAAVNVNIQNTDHSTAQVLPMNHLNTPYCLQQRMQTNPILNGVDLAIVNNNIIQNTHSEPYIENLPGIGNSMNNEMTDSRNIQNKQRNERSSWDCRQNGFWNSNQDIYVRHNASRKMSLNIPFSNGELLYNQMDTKRYVNNDMIHYNINNNSQPGNFNQLQTPQFQTIDFTNNQQVRDRGHSFNHFNSQVINNVPNMGAIQNFGNSNILNTGSSHISNITQNNCPSNNSLFSMNNSFQEFQHNAGITNGTSFQANQPDLNSIQTNMIYMKNQRGFNDTNHFQR